nr:pectinesterase family protein [Fredinandcohnia onubensis]
MKKKSSRLTAIMLSLILLIGSFPLPMVVKAENVPMNDTTYHYDFSELLSYTSSNPIDTVWSSDGLVRYNGAGKMYHHGDKHGLVVNDGSSFDIKVAGNAIITFTLCQYGNSGSIDVSGGASGSAFSTESVDLLVPSDGDQASFIYSGDATMLNFKINGSGYVHAITVENTSKEVEITPWIKKDFTMKIGDATLDVTGASKKSENATVSISSGSVYYSSNANSYISTDLAGRSLGTSILTNVTPDVVQNVAVDHQTNEIIATFADQTTNPKEFKIKVQDTSAFVTPGVSDVYTFDLAGGAVPTEFTKASPIESFTTDNGLLKIAKGSSSNNPYWHDNSHGIAAYDGNYFDVKVAGDADIIFYICRYGSGEKLEVTNLAPGGTGSFDKNVFVSETDDDAITYSYTGDATTLRFTVAASGESYLHSITVKNKGTVESSPVANEQPSMPSEIDPNGTLNVTAQGHRLYVGHSDSEATISEPQKISYYVFNGREKVTTIEADIKISAIGSSSNNGLFFGMMEDASEISKIATVGIRGDGRIRNVYSKTTTPSTPSAGSMDIKYSVGDVIHLLSKKDENGWHTEATVNSETTKVDIDYSKIADIDANTSVKYGFGFANVNAVITNLTLKDDNGNELYNQNKAYEPIGTAPTVSSVESPVVSSDRTKVTVNWSGETPDGDGAYVVELSTDGGKTYTTLSSRVTEKSYTVDVEESGNYQFRISGICGDEKTPAVVSASIDILKPLTQPIVTIESGDRVLTVKWDRIGEANSYEVYRKTSEQTEYSLIDEISDPSYIDRNVVNETPYYYYVIAKSDSNSSNPSVPVLSVPTAGRTGQYVYEDKATEIFITKKSYDTVFTNKATIQGVVGNKGKMKVVVNDVEIEEVSLKAKESFDFLVSLEEGRNDVNFYFTDTDGGVTRKTFNFVYLTNYDMVVNAAYSGIEGAESTEIPGVKVFSTVQAAVNSVPSDNKERVVILIKEGTYFEHLRVSSPYISLIGEDQEKVNLQFYDSVLSPEGGSTSDRNATYIQSTATGFSAENLTFENTYKYLGDGTKSNESADALRVDADESTFVNVKLVGYQDTLMANSNHQYYYKSHILGNVDFIYGSAQALFEDTDIVFRYNANKNSGYVSAPRTDKAEKYGYIFYNSRITAEEGASGSKYLLARPWGPDGAATFINTYMSDIINKETPYADMSGNLAVNARFYEYYSYGGGFAIHSGRPQISKSQAEEMVTPSYLGWDPHSVITATSKNEYVGNVQTQTEEKFVEKEYVNDAADPDSTDDTGLGKFELEGYAQAQGVTGGGLLLETSTNYYKVSSAEEFLNALFTIKSNGKASVIELTKDIGLGSIEIGDVMKDYSGIIKPANHQPLLHPTLLEAGVSTIDIDGMSNLTIFSQNGAKLNHVTFNIANSSNIIIRNLVFDELWEWDEFSKGDYDRNDWDYITVQEGSTGIWIDHSTFYKAYDGIIDVKKAGNSNTTDVTISWSEFLPGSEGSFFDVMMEKLETNPEQYPYYNELLTTHGMTKEQIREYSFGQKKLHLVGASDTEENTSNLRVTLANNFYKNSMDRIPRLRGGYGHVYNTIIDSSELYELRKSLADEAVAEKIVSNGAISTLGASVLVENSTISGVMRPLLSGNGSSPAGYIDAVNSLYTLDDVKEELSVIDYTGSGLTLNVSEFRNSLPYNDYQLYEVDSLYTLVYPYVGAGKIQMTPVQWEKVVYNDVSEETPGETPETGENDNGEEGKQQEGSDKEKDKDKDKDGTHEDGQEKQDKDSNNSSDGKELPKTATSIYNWLMLGGAFLLAGVAIYLYQRRKRLN